MSIFGALAFAREIVAFLLGREFIIDGKVCSQNSLMFLGFLDFYRRSEEACRLTMIKLFSVKEKQKEDAQNNNGCPIKKQSVGELWVQKDVSELNLAKTISTHFPNGKDNLLILRSPSGRVYPHEASKVKYKTKDPNLDDPVNHEAAEVLGTILVSLSKVYEDQWPVVMLVALIFLDAFRLQ